MTMSHLQGGSRQERIAWLCLKMAAYQRFISQFVSDRIPSDVVVAHGECVSFIYYLGYLQMVCST